MNAVSPIQLKTGTEKLSPGQQVVQAYRGLLKPFRLMRRLEHLFEETRDVTELNFRADRPKELEIARLLVLHFSTRQDLETTIGEFKIAIDTPAERKQLRYLLGTMWDLFGIQLALEGRTAMLADLLLDEGGDGEDQDGVFSAQVIAKAIRLSCLASDFAPKPHAFRGACFEARAKCRQALQKTQHLLSLYGDAEYTLADAGERPYPPSKPGDFDWGADDE